jgi:hypothetical protein
VRRGLTWYKREQRSMLDAILAAKMTDRQAAIYNIIVDLIYDGGGETPDDPRHVSSYLSNVGTAAARTTIQQLIDMGKLHRIDGMLHQKRAENEAKTRRNLSETRAESGRLGGVSSGVSRRELRKINDLVEAFASTKHQAEKSRVEREKKEREERDPRRQSDPTTARETDDKDFHSKILAEAGIDVTRDTSGKWFSSDQTWRANRWVTDLKLTEAEVIMIIGEVTAKRRNGPPGSLAYFDQAMQEAAGRKQTGQLKPEKSGRPPPGSVFGEGPERE